MLESTLRYMTVVNDVIRKTGVSNIKGTYLVWQEIFLPDQEESILLDRKSPALHLIQRIRDEAHRFGITHHRSLRQKAGMHSSLEDIPGIGPARRRALLAHFKSIANIAAVSYTHLDVYKRQVL